MSDSHHDEHHSGEQKPVAFTVPIIFAGAVVLIILMFLSLCDPKKHHGNCECKEGCSKECMEACEKGDHSKHGEGKMESGHMMTCGHCKSECSKECMEACEKGDHSKHKMAAMEGDHKMMCEHCKSECSEECMASCEKGDHSKHKMMEAPMDSTKAKEPAPAH